MKKLKRIAVAYPSGNTTAIIFAPVNTENKKALNTNIMRAWKNLNPGKPEIEQVCYIASATDPKNLARVEMLGGEFCGNATRAVIQLLTEGRDSKGNIEVSGVEGSLTFSVRNGVVGLQMPLSKNTDSRLLLEGRLVQFEGIAQLVATEEMRKNLTPRELLAKILANKKYALKKQPAVGVSYFDPVSKLASFCVWVKNVNTIFDETACGSGTAAIGVELAYKNRRNVRARIIQPSGGWIKTAAVYDVKKKRATSVSIKGKVKDIYQGELQLS